MGNKNGDVKVSMDFQMCCKGCWPDLGLHVEKFSQNNILVGAISTLTRYL